MLFSYYIIYIVYIHIYIFYASACFSLLHSPVSVFRRLFCGEKPQRSWGKETSTSAMSRPNPEPSQLTQSSQRCEGDAINWKYTDTPQLFTAEQPEVWGLPRSLPGLRNVCIHEYTLYTFRHPPHHITASGMSCSTTITLLPPGLKHTHIQTHKSAEC